MDPTAVQELLTRLEEDRKAYLASINQTHELLAKAIAGNAPPASPPPPAHTTERYRRNTGNTFATALDVESVSLQKSSTLSPEDESDTDDDEALFVQDTLPAESYHEEGLRAHIRDYAWTDSGRSILGDLLDGERPLHQRAGFPTSIKAAEDRSHLSHYSIFDVGTDGAPLQLQFADNTPLSRARDIWRRINGINADNARQKLAVGRITIVREPSPLLFAALHYTLQKHFDVDEMFGLLVGQKTKAFSHRPWSDDPRHRRSFVFTFEYFTIIGDECQPMKWQRADEQLDESSTHIPISRCASVIALSFEGEPISRLRHRGRRNPLGRKEGEVFDPFSPWLVMSMQAYPDWRSTVNSHDSTKHYVNGPEAFLMTLRAEFKDAQKRLMDVYNRISDLVTTPADFMFRQDVRDKLLFEDDEFTYSRRYFWAYQSLAIMNEDIKEMLIAYKESFTEAVWNGTSRIIWPGDEKSARHIHWRKRMAVIRKDIERELRGLEEIDKLNDEKMKEIKALRDNLFSGTSVLESRRSVQQQAITVVQGNNIKILTLVTIFFLPLTFVTSVFGMTNMDPNENFVRFGIVTATICVPTYFLIGSLNTESGFEFWTEKMHRVFTIRFWRLALARFCGLFGYKPNWGSIERKKTSSIQPTRPENPRSASTAQSMAARGTYANGAATFPISPAVTQERNTIIRFESKGSMDFMSSPTAINSDPMNARPTQGIQKDVVSQSTANEAKGSWASRLFGWKSKGDSKEGEREFP